jgi:hypothetical protein
MGVEVFAYDLRAALAEHLAPAEVSFRGSFARGGFDEFSDVDLEAAVGVPLGGPFFARLEAFLTDRYGPALVRYDPEFRGDLAAQGVSFSFRELPVFWRLDLTVRSSAPAASKWPSPFPDWQVGTSALMNLLWAVKCRQRGSAAAADYLWAACRKLGLGPVPASAAGVRAVLAQLWGRPDVDLPLLRAVADTAEQT